MLFTAVAGRRRVVDKVPSQSNRRQREQQQPVQNQTHTERERLVDEKKDRERVSKARPRKTDWKKKSRARTRERRKRARRPLSGPRVLRLGRPSLPAHRPSTTRRRRAIAAANRDVVAAWTTSVRRPSCARPDTQERKKSEEKEIKLQEHAKKNEMKNKSALQL